MINKTIIDSYRLNLRLALTMHRILLFASALVGILVVAAFTAAVFYAWVANNYLVATIFLALACVLFLGLRSLLKSSQALVKEANNFSKKTAREIEAADDASLAELASQLAKICRFEQQT